MSFFANIFEQWTSKPPCAPPELPVEILPLAEVRARSSECPQIVVDEDAGTAPEPQGTIPSEAPAVVEAVSVQPTEPEPPTILCPSLSHRARPPDREVATVLHDVVPQIRDARAVGDSRAELRLCKEGIARISSLRTQSKNTDLKDAVEALVECERSLMRRSAASE